MVGCGISIGDVTACVVLATHKGPAVVLEMWQICGRQDAAQFQQFSSLQLYHAPLREMCLVYDAIRRIGPRCVHSRYNPHLLARIVKNRDQYVAYNNQIEQYIKHAIKYFYSLHYKASMYAIFSRTWTGF